MALASKVRRAASRVVKGVKKELSALDTLHPQALAALKRAERRDPGLKLFLKRSHGYAVFPSVGKAAAALGAAFGTGEVFERGKLVGYAGILQMTLGAQLGGQTFVEIIAFENEQSLDRFRRSRSALAANASAVMVKAGAAASADYEQGVAVFVQPQGGMMLEAAVGGQKFIFKPAVLGRGKPVTHAKKTSLVRRKRRVGTGGTGEN
jgi:lipid-binding SYLF domain-containing protein